MTAYDWEDLVPLKQVMWNTWCRVEKWAKNQLIYAKYAGLWQTPQAFTEADEEQLCIVAGCVWLN